MNSIKGFFEDFGGALIEAVMIFFFTNLPFFLFLIIRYSPAQDESEPESFLAIILKMMQPEEVLSYMAALFASVFYIYFIQNLKARGRFHSLLSTVFLWFFTIVPFAFLFFATLLYFEAKQLNDSFNLAGSNLQFLFQSFVIAALVTWFLSLWAQRHLERNPGPIIGSADQLYKLLKTV